jgi:hypothetical protein
VIDVIWAQWAPDVSNRGYWDQGLLEDYFADQMSPSGLTFTHHDAFETVRPGAGAIVVIPARHYVGELAEINADLARLPWALVVLTGDEQAAFHAGGLKHPNMRVWIQSPDSIARPEYPRAWPNGYPPGLRTYLRKTEPWRWPRREYDWVFAGQVTHKTREDCATALLDLPGGLFSGTAGFTQGMPQSDYWSLLTDAKVAPCPSGPFTPDTFRVYEALEAGCVPVVDTYPPGKRRNPTRFWLDMFGEETFPVFALQHWQHFPELLEEILHEFPSLGYQTLASWMLYKRTLSERFTADITELSGVAPRSVVDGITVLMSTSPSPKHPSTALFDETLESVRERLPGAEVIVMADGVHSAHESLHAAYDEYLADMVWRCNDSCAEWTPSAMTITSAPGRRSRTDSRVSSNSASSDPIRAHAVRAVHGARHATGRQHRLRRDRHRASQWPRCHAASPRGRHAARALPPDARSRTDHLARDARQGAAHVPVVPAPPCRRHRLLRANTARPLRLVGTRVH